MKYISGLTVKWLWPVLSFPECELVKVGDNNRCLAVRLGMAGTAMMDLDADTVKKI